MSSKKKPLFHLDSPRCGMMMSNGEVSISGWFSDANGVPAQSVTIHIGDRVETAFSERRPDVRRALVSQGLNATGEGYGFKKQVVLRRSAPYCMRIVATTQDGDAVLVGFKLVFNRVREVVYVSESSQQKPMQEMDKPHERVSFFADDRYLVFVSHDASLTGAPMVLLRLVRRLSRHKRLKVAVVLMADGPLLKDFESAAKTVMLADLKTKLSTGEDFYAVMRGALGGEPGMVVGNTVIFGREIALFQSLGVPVYTWVHELGRSIVTHGWLEDLKSVVLNSQSVLCAAEQVRSFIITTHPEVAKRCIVLKPFIDDAPSHSERLASNKVTIWCCGTPEVRKGVDIAIDVASRLKRNRGADFEIVWIGPINAYAESCLPLIQEKELGDVFRFAGSSHSPRENFGDGIFLMPSREDPFPMVCLEAAQCGLPIVCFDGAGGMHEFVSDDAGIVVPHLDLVRMTEACDQLLNNRELRRSLGARGSCKVAAEYHEEGGARLFLSAVGLRGKSATGAASTKRILVLSYGPPPISKTAPVEGGGLRCWGMSSTLASQLPSAEIHLRYHISQGAPVESEKDGVLIGNWNDATLENEIEKYDGVVISYCMGGWGAFIAARVRPWQRLVLDCYVPIYVEVSARKPKDMNQEMLAYQNDIHQWNAALLRGDYYLYANHNQRIFYLGVLSALGVLNPSTYANFNRLLHVPYGVYGTTPEAKCDPYKSLLRNKSAPRILWFGGVYPWFDIGTFLKAIKEVNRRTGAELVMVGAKNPFVVNSDFIAKYNELFTSLDELGLNEIVHVTDWVPFDTRADWFLKCDLIVTINKEGIENEFAWRTRLVDYVWSGSPVATNGGDPLGDALIAHGAAIRLDSHCAELMADEICETLGDSERLKAMGESMKNFRNSINWSCAVAPLAAALGADV